MSKYNNTWCSNITSFKESNISRLPYYMIGIMDNRDILINVASHLPYNEIYMLLYICKSIHIAINNDEFWKPIIIVFFSLCGMQKRLKNEPYIINMKERKKIKVKDFKTMYLHWSMLIEYWSKLENSGTMMKWNIRYIFNGIYSWLQANKTEEVHLDYIPIFITDEDRFYRQKNPLCAICRNKLYNRCLDCEDISNKDIELKIKCPFAIGKCKHIFHSHCIERWLIQRPIICPLDGDQWEIIYNGSFT